MNDGVANHAFQSVEDLYRREYFEAIDSVKGDLEKRFTQQNFLFVRSVEALLIDSANGKPVSLPEKMFKMYERDVDMQKLKLQLQLLQDAIKSVPLDGIRIREVTRIQTICDVFNKESSLKKFLTEIHKLLKLYLTIPVTTASSKRSFSALKHVKTYLRSSMTQNRLNHCMLLHVHKDKTKKLDLRQLAEEFVKVNDTRIRFFGVF